MIGRIELNNYMPTFIHKQCFHCNSEFTVIPREQNQRFCSIQCSGKSRRTKLRTLSCLQCGKPINGTGKFCNRSCAAMYNNAIRPIESRLKQKQTMLVKFPPKEPKEKPIRIKVEKKKVDKLCASCHSVLIDKHRKYCESCYGNIRHYRSLARFTFNVYDYPNEFELYLIDKHGWFSPNGYKCRNKNVNLTGISRDHMFAISDGFKLGVDPRILSHPANCKLMIHNGPNGNNAKKYSSITFEELLQRISNWDKKYS